MIVPFVVIDPVTVTEPEIFTEPVSLKPFVILTEPDTSNDADGL